MPRAVPSLASLLDDGEARKRRIARLSHERELARDAEVYRAELTDQLKRVERRLVVGSMIGVRQDRVPDRRDAAVVQPRAGRPRAQQRGRVEAVVGAAEAPARLAACWRAAFTC